MQHMIICPTVYLEKFAVLSKYHLVLAHMVDGSSKYRDFYSSLDSSNFITLDNSSYEIGDGVYSPDDLIAMGGSLSKNSNIEIMAPETFEDGRDTAWKVLDFCHNVRSEVKVFGTVHGKTLDEIIECFLEIYRVVDTIGFSCRLDYDSIPVECANKSLERSFKRFLLIKTIVRKIEKFKLKVDHLKFHLMGMNHPIELMWYDNLIRSVDSSCAYTAARDGIVLEESFMNYIKPRSKIDFGESKIGMGGEVRVLANMNFLNSLMNRSRSV